MFASETNRLDDYVKTSKGHQLNSFISNLFLTLKSYETTKMKNLSGIALKPTSLLIKCIAVFMKKMTKYLVTKKLFWRLEVIDW